MKKYLSIILMLLACLGMTAQSQQGYLTLRMADGQTFSLKDSDIEKMTFSTRPTSNIDHMWYVIGADVADGSWSFNVPTSRLPLYSDNLEQGLLTYTGYFAGLGFKLVGEDWSEQWGAWGYGDFVKNDGGSGNICVPTPGYYTVQLDAKSNQLNIETADVVVIDYAAISLVGSFNYWGDDLALTRVAGTNSHDWYAEVTFVEDCELKFRANYSWDMNWGSTVFPSAQGKINGANIPVKAGRYIVLFNDITGHYRFYDPELPNMEVYQPMLITDAMTIAPGETRVEFETYTNPTVQLCTGVSLPLVVDYDAAYELSLRYDSKSTVVGNWSSTDDPEFGQVQTVQLASIVESLCGRASVERLLDVVVTARVTVNGFPEVYTASTPITCLLPSSTFPEFVYFIGATDGWASSDQRLRSPDLDGVYKGFVYCADPNGWGNEFKLQRRQGDWADDSQLNSNNVSFVLGDFEKGPDNFGAAGGEGVYYVEFDLINNVLSGTRIQNMNLVGDFNGWNSADDTMQMEWDAEHYCFVKTGVAVSASGYGWKFTANNSWAINLGGTPDNLEVNGLDLMVSGTTVRLYPTRRDRDNIYCTVE